MSLNSFRRKLASPQPSWQLCFLGLVGGSLAGGFIVLFRLLLDFVQKLYLEHADDFTTLDIIARFDLPIAGALIILLISGLTGYQYTRMGIPFVLHRLKSAYGQIPIPNTLNQYFGSLIALASGFSVGREGPAVHIGAAASSYIGTKLALPYNSIRTLCACGIAAGISASFNTPVAAVIFVMEVILREYKVHIFIPVMIASIAGSILTHSVFGGIKEFEFFETFSLSPWHLPSLALLGIVLGLVAFAFNRYLVAIINHSKQLHIFTRIMLAALITGILGIAVPYCLGTGLSAITFSIAHQTELIVLFSLLAAKFLATIIAIGLGVPGGIIGPILGIGAIVGVITSVFAHHIIPEANIASDFALMGMAGLMAASLHAPMAALVTLIELSHQLEVTLPAMIVITFAYLTANQFLKGESIFIMQLKAQKLPFMTSALENTLQKIGVLHEVNRNFRLLENSVDIDQIKQQVSDTVADVLIYKENDKFTFLSYDAHSHPKDPQPFTKFTMPGISSQDTLAEAYLALIDARQGAVYIYDQHPDNIIGFITFEKIRAHLI